jgi:hypothetical protein
MSDRGMKKWLPFSALVEQNEFLEKMIYEKNKIKKPQISVEQASKIDRILKEHADNVLTFKIYLDGYLYTFNGKIEKIDLPNHKIYFKDFFVPIKDILDIDDPEPFDSIS